MKEKGFTLIELLAVIVILAIIALIATPIVLNIIEDSKKSAFLQTGNGIVDAAEYYYMNEMSDGVKPTEEKKFEFDGSKNGLEKLEFDGEIPQDGTLTVDVNGNIKLAAHNNQYCITKGYDETEVTIKDYDGNCEIFEPICKLVNDSDNSETITVGDKYQCKVKDNMEVDWKDGYYFYVLSLNDDDTTNLIMDRNIYYDSAANIGVVADSKNTGEVAWISADDYNGEGFQNTYGSSGTTENAKEGPITAMNYLYNATKDWANIPDMVMNYTDARGEYGTIVTTDGITKITKKDGTGVTVLKDKEGYTNLKARMPYKSEVSEYDGTNAYLYDNLDSTGEITYSGNITGIYGYWTPDIGWVGPFMASGMYVKYTGRFASHIYGAGVRPVITISNTELL